VIKKEKKREKRRYMSGQDFPEREILPGLFWPLFFLRIFTGPLPVILSPFLPVPGMPVLPGSVQKGRKGVFFLHI